jgi:SpoVK/Ycf46/Vps4 family AAA+-type ATPase
VRVSRETQDDAPAGLRFWSPAADKRYPWCRPSIAAELESWMHEAEHGDILAEAGERVMPLLLSGETRCGKTSSVCQVASYFDVPAYRMSIGSIVDSYMGQTTKNLKAAIEEAMIGPTALWIMDEIDGVFQRREQSGRGGAVQETNRAISVALAMIEQLPPHVMLVGTTNEVGLIDPAMLARFRHVRFPAWAELDEQERRAFAKSHKHEDGWQAGSYSDVVQAARTVRVRKIIETAEAAKEPTAPKVKRGKKNLNGVDTTPPDGCAF